MSNKLMIHITIEPWAAESQKKSIGVTNSFRCFCSLSDQNNIDANLCKQFRKGIVDFHFIRVA